MRQTTRNVLIVAAFVGTFAAGGGAGKVVAQDCPPIRVQLPEAVCPDVQVHVDPIVCECSLPPATGRTGAGPITCPTVQVEIVPAASRPIPDYWLDLLLTANDDSATASLVWNRWKRVRPVLAVSYVEGYEFGADVDHLHVYNQPPVANVGQRLRAEVGIAVALWPSKRKQ